MVEAPQVAGMKVAGDAVPSDRDDCVARLSAAALGRAGAPFQLSAAAFVAMFGSPGACTCGEHTVDDATKHRVIVARPEHVKAVFGDDSPSAGVVGSFTIVHDGKETAELYTEAAPGQGTLAGTFSNGSRPSAQVLATKAAAKAAAASAKDPFVIDDSDDDESEAPAKRQRTE